LCPEGTGGRCKKTHKLNRLSRYANQREALTQWPSAAAIALLTLRPSPAEQRPEPVEGPTLTIIADTILDASTGTPIRADVYINGALIYQSVTQFQVTVPLDGSTEVRITAPGYKPWGVIPKGGGSNKVLQGPIRLNPELTGICGYTSADYGLQIHKSYESSFYFLKIGALTPTTTTPGATSTCQQRWVQESSLPARCHKAEGVPVETWHRTFADVRRTSVDETRPGAGLARLGPDPRSWTFADVHSRL
jgi:hypothetical protein